MGIERLGYLGFEVSDLDAWRHWSEKMVGSMQTQATEQLSFFRIDSRAWRYAIHQGDADDLSYIGFEVADMAALSQLEVQLKEQGVPVRRESDDVARKRCVMELLSCQDPFGTTIEIYCGATEVFEHPLISPTGISGFVTGDQGMGHAVLNVPDMQRATEFYTQALGFRLADVIDWELDGQSVSVSFFYCNERHHSFALLSTPQPKKLHHFMLEVESLDDVGLAYDRFTDAGAVVMTLGRHTNDHMCSFYGATPSGFAVEIGWGARPVDRHWSTVRYDRISIWGHRFVG